MERLTRRSMLGALPAIGLPMLGLNAPAHAQQIPDAPGMGPRLAPGSDGEIDYLPDSWVDIHGRPTARVTINGLGPFQFMVDTGSTTTVIANRLLEALGTQPTGFATVAGTTGVAEMPIARLERVTCGVVSKENLRVAVLPDAAMAQEDGILGADVFAGRRLVFNIRQKQVRVETSRRIARKSFGNMRVRNGLLAEIDGKVGNVNTKLMLDTGAQNCIANMALSHALQRQHPRLQRVDSVRVYGVTGHKIVGQYIAMPRVNLKAFHVDDAGCVAADAPIFDLWGLASEPAMIVGVNLLSRLDSFSIDYGARNFDATLMSDLMARNAAAFG
jgi:predicted aspartyl protease